MRYRFSGVVTGRLTTLQISASPTLSQQVDSLAQVLLLDEFMLFTCKDTAEEYSYVSISSSSAVVKFSGAEWIIHARF